MSALTRWGFDRAAGARKRPVPLVRAYRGPYPDLSSRTMAEVMRDEARAEKEAGPRIKSGVTKINDGLAALGIKSGVTVEVEGRRAKAGGEAQGGRICKPCVEPVSRPAAGRTAAATPEIMDVTAGEMAPKSKQAEVFPPKPASAPVAAAIAPPCRTTPPPARAPISTRGEGGRGQSVPPLTQQGAATTRQAETLATGNVAKQQVSTQESTVALTGRALKTDKIELANAPSGMEAVALKWRGPAEQRGALPPVPGEDGKVWCVGCDARVPTWFGRDCISVTCSLKGSQ